MNSNFKKAAFAIGIIALGITGCKKECMNEDPNKSNNTESDIQSLAMQTESEIAAIEILYDETTNEMTAPNEGIAADYLVSVEDMDADENTLNSSAPARNDIRNHSFIRCLKHVKLDSDQVGKVRIVLGEFHDCKASAIDRARAIHHKLQEKYQALAQDQAKLLREGKITKKEYEERIARLRKAFQKELRELQLKEKVRETLKNCHTKLLRQLNGILTERQWRAFVDCCRK